MEKMPSCLRCGKQVKRLSSIYCSTKCQVGSQRDEYLDLWRKGKVDGRTPIHGSLSLHIRTYLFERAGSKCELCGWGEINPLSGKTPLEVDHINGDYTDNRECNLRLICPNCHALTPTYKALNRGHGRTNR